MKPLAKWHAKAGVEFTRVEKNSAASPDTVDRNGVHLFDGDQSSRYEIQPSGRYEWLDNVRQTELPSVLDSIHYIVDHNPKLKDLTWNVGTDPGCIEIPTAPLKSWSKLRSFYMQMDKICADHGFTANDLTAGTGSHIHVEHKDNQELKAKVVRDQFYRPYVAWAFSNPQDTGNANALCRFKFARFELDKHRKKYYEETVYRLDSWSGAIRLQESTIEFRVFDMTWSWEEQEEHMAYVQAYMAWIQSDKYVAPAPLKHTNLKHIPIASLERDFKAHILELGLPWERYYKYVGNIRGRKHWKTNRGTINSAARKPLELNVRKYDTKVVLDYLHSKKNVE